jgi:fructose-bisphosphate aldolase class I
MSIEQLAETARAMVAPGKGIIAIDESSGTCAKRFAGVGIENTEENRRAYRELLLTAPNANQYLSGAILFDETIRQSTKSGIPFAKYMADNGMIPGIKVDKGTQALAASRVSWSPRAWTACATAWPSTTSWARDSRSGAR